MKEVVSRGLKRDQLFRTNASGRTIHQKKRRSNSNRKKRKERTQGKTFLFCFEKRLTPSRREIQMQEGQGIKNKDELMENEGEREGEKKKNTMQIIMRKKVDGSTLKPFD